MKGNNEMALKRKIDFSKCTSPALQRVVEHEGGIRQAAAALKFDKSTIARWIHGGSMAAKFAVDIEAKAASYGNGSAHDEASPARVGGGLERTPPRSSESIPPWDGAKRTLKLPSVAGKKPVTFKNVPVPLADLIERHNGIRHSAGVALGFNTGSSINNILIGAAKYKAAFHERVVRALRGENPSSEEVHEDAMDNYKLNIAIITVSMQEIERMLDLGKAMGAHLEFKMSLGNPGWLLVFSQKDREKLAMFKRLGARDSKRFVCP